ncbi:MAG: endonuclease domain-containing protein [Paraburkholderia sp.]|jgi:very-short-patch-repair endonuclease|nr:endonuclease domain-containing protein [Paraburkholderia sp.]
MPRRKPTGSDRILAEIAGASRALRRRGPVALDPALAKMVGARDCEIAQKRKFPAAPSVIEETFALHVRAEKLPAPEREVQFDPTRRWRFDFAWSEQRLAVEVEGGIHAGGRHTRGTGFEADARKYLAAMLAGWRVVRVTAAMVNDGSAVDAVRQLLQR